MLIKTHLFPYKGKVNRRKGIVILDDSLRPNYKWLFSLADRMGLELICTNHLPIEKVLLNIPIQEMQLVLLPMNSKAGFNLLNWIEEKVESIRSMIPGISILCLQAPNYFTVNSNLLPPRVEFVNHLTPKETWESLLQESIQAIKDLHFYSTTHFPTMVSNSHNHNRVPIPSSYTLPNFNIKHSGMLIPIARLAKKYQTPLYVEISPQEALVYYDTPSTSSTERVKKAFQKIREDVDWVCKQLDVKLYLHLDHCMDFELIQYALDIGFNSIMADGSLLPLHANIRFTNKAKALADSYGIPTEGEIGAIDLEHLRKRSTTEITDAITYLKETEVDYLGINVGQFHSGDYGFERARAAFLTYLDLKKRNFQRDRNLWLASNEIDQKLSLEEMHHDQRLRITIRNIVEEILSDSPRNPSDIFSHLELIMPLNELNWLQKLKNLWIEKNKITDQQIVNSLKKVIGKSVSHDPKLNRHLNFELMHNLYELVKDTSTRLVLHGGSSIDEHDYYFFNEFEIGRVNIGSTPFMGYLDVLHSAEWMEVNKIEKPGGEVNSSVVAFLHQQGRHWKDWLEEDPSFLKRYQNDIENRYIMPLVPSTNEHHE